MKKKAAIFISTILVFCLAACGADNNGGNQNHADNTPAINSKPSVENIPTAGPEDALGQSGTETVDDLAGAETDTTGSNILIAYFSIPEDVDITGVDAVAGASVVVKEGKKLGNTEYVAGLIQQTIGGDLFRIETIDPYPLDHDPLVDQAAEEQDDDFRPELAAHVENFGQYEYVFLGFPNWWGDMPMAVYSFLEEYDFGSKTIVPFITHGGSQASRTVETISQIQPGALIMGNELVLSRGDVAKSEETVVDWAQNLGINTKAMLPEEGDGNTVMSATADAHNSQTLYLWEEGNAPAVTEYTVNNGSEAFYGGYADGPDFRPYIVTFPVPGGDDGKRCCVDLCRRGFSVPQ